MTIKKIYIIRAKLFLLDLYNSVYACMYDDRNIIQLLTVRQPPQNTIIISAKLLNDILIR